MGHQVCHAHCPGGGGGATAAVVAVVIVAAVVARPVVHAADAVLRVVTQVLEITGIVVASAAGLAVVAAAVVLAVRVRRRVRVKAVSGPLWVQVPAAAPAANLDAAQERVIAPPQAAIPVITDAPEHARLRSPR
jgi:hypothetical protein